ncbi:MAG: DUF1622 domain-containing protein [Dehalococcoidales bacterium]|nr:DUF1622 domain-containing protein [Dehalococcoidales bacterium]
MELLHTVIGLLAFVVEAIGVAVVLVAVIIGLSPYVLTCLRRRPPPIFGEVHARMGRGLVLSLELFIAADLLRLILHPALQEIAVLGVIILLRTILSLSLVYELRQPR